MKVVLLLTLFNLLITYSFADSFSDLDSIKEIKELNDMRLECQMNQEYLGKTMQVNCFHDYHHYNSKASRKYYKKASVVKKGEVKIAQFNVLHPGMSKTRFKDYKKVAQIINKFDIVAVTELIPAMSDILENNMALKEFLNFAPLEIKRIEKEIKSLKESIENSTRSTTVKQRRLSLLKKKKWQLIEDLRDAPSLYRKPGYLKILTELRKLYKSEDWALILSPRGEGAETSDTKELVGYYYRASMVKPLTHKYCLDRRIQSNEAAYACIARMDKKDFIEDKRSVFSRRPFTARFISGKFSYTLIASHVLYDSPTDPERMSNVLRPSFGVDSYENLGPGITKKNYARVAEVKTTIDFISQVLKEKYKLKNVIMLGDLNLKAHKPYWDTILSGWKNSQMYIHEPTSVSERRYDSTTGEESNGVSSNYDHIILNPKANKACLDENGKFKGGVYNFIKTGISRYIEGIYKIRNEIKVTDDTYMKNETRYNKVYKRFVAPLLDGSKPIFTIGRKYIENGMHRMVTEGIIVDAAETNEQANMFIERVMDSQLHDDTYYKFFEQLVSDHMPVYTTCMTR